MVLGRRNRGQAHSELTVTSLDISVFLGTSIVLGVSNMVVVKYTYQQVAPVYICCCMGPYEQQETIPGLRNINDTRYIEDYLIIKDNH